MTNRNAFLAGSAEASQGPLLLKQVAIGNGKYISLVQMVDNGWQVRVGSDWVQPCLNLAEAERELGRQISIHIKEIALHALGVSNGPDDG